jgi:hypothetical protein
LQGEQGGLGLSRLAGGRATLARELPKVIAYHEAWLTYLGSLAKAGERTPEEAEQAAKALLKKIREASQRLDALKRR